LAPEVGGAATTAAASTSEGFDWQKKLLLGAAIGGAVAALAYYLLSDSKGEKRTQLKNAVDKFDEGVRAKESMELEEAETLITEALITFRKYLSPTDDAIAQCLLELSQLNLAMGRVDKAREFANESLNIKEKDCGETTAICAALLQLARSYMITKDWTEAEKFIDRAQAIYESETGVARDLLGLGTAIRTKSAVYFKQRNYAKAELAAKEALATQIRERKGTSYRGIGSEQSLQGRVGMPKPYRAYPRESWQVR